MTKQVSFGHGDVLFEKIDSLPQGLVNLNTNVVQEGEHTGHAHRLTSGEYEVLQHPETKVKYLRVITEARISHEEHKTQELPGNHIFRIGIMKEFDYDSMEQRQVVD
jgi:hypothetical protein